MADDEQQVWERAFIVALTTATDDARLYLLNRARRIADDATSEIVKRRAATQRQKEARARGGEG